MKNFIQPGDTITITAPAGGLLSGAGALLGALFGVAATAAASGAEVELATRGVFDLPKAAGDALAVGDKVYWDDTAKAVTSTTEGNTLIGIALLAALAGAATARVRLNGAAL